MNDSIANTYSDARSEYTKQLCQILVPSYFQWYLTVLEKARTTSNEKQEPKKLLWHFQNLLNDIPEWNMEKVNTEIAQLQTSCGCDYLEDLLTAVFIAHTKVLTAIRVSNKQKRVQITVPKVEHFMFKVLCETSKILWGSSFLFREGINSIDKQQNYRSIEGLLGEGVLQAVRNMIPVKSILRDFVSVDDDDEEKDEKDEEKEEEKTEETKEVKTEETKEVKEAEPVTELKPIETIDVSASDIVVNTITTVAALAPIIDVSANDVSANPVSANPIITIDTDKSSHVKFADYKSVFDSDNPDDSDMIQDGDERSGSDQGRLELMDGPAEPLGIDDVEDLDKPIDEGLGSDDYEVIL
uniref:Uncharacterized protein n=1 Tax=viral metagenome TaxID=1070528 RepID=A0A6C0DI85_9ZZZZ